MQSWESAQGGSYANGGKDLFKGLVPWWVWDNNRKRICIGDLKIRSHEPAKHLLLENGLIISGNNDTTIIVMPADIS